MLANNGTICARRKLERLDSSVEWHCLCKVALLKLRKLSAAAQPLGRRRRRAQPVVGVARTAASPRVTRRIVAPHASPHDSRTTPPCMVDASQPPCSRAALANAFLVVWFAAPAAALLYFLSYSRYLQALLA